MRKISLTAAIAAAFLTGMRFPDENVPVPTWGTWIAGWAWFIALPIIFLRFRDRLENFFELLLRPIFDRFPLLGKILIALAFIFTGYMYFIGGPFLIIAIFEN